MSYCVTITRRTNDEGAAEPAIGLDEWKTVVDSDTELSNPADYKVVRWRGVSSEREPTFEWCDGEIFVHNPDTAQLKKIGMLAVRLGARVVTEEGEIAQFEEQVQFDPPTAYDAYLSTAGTRQFTWDAAIDFVAAHLEVVFRSPDWHS
jgi:hypothetical protein